jgi:hypothetical protein
MYILYVVLGYICILCTYVSIAMYVYSSRSRIYIYIFMLHVQYLMKGIITVLFLQLSILGNANELRLRCKCSYGNGLAHMRVEFL